MKEWIRENITMIPIYAVVISAVIAWIISIRFIITGTSIVDAVWDLIHTKNESGTEDDM